MYLQCCFLRSTSVHKRHIFGPLGDEGNFKVRMSNLINRNRATFLRLLKEHGRFFYTVLEQPSSSYLFKTEWFLALSFLLGCMKVTTWTLVFERFVSNLFQTPSVKKDTYDIIE